VIYKSAILAALALAVVAVLTGKNVTQHRTLVLNGLTYEVTRYSDNTVDVVRQDGLRFSVSLKTGASTLKVGTQSQLEDALWRLKAVGLAGLEPLGPPS
jgi:hypothetical protein